MERKDPFREVISSVASCTTESHDKGAKATTREEPTFFPIWDSFLSFSDT
ncbi:hypothetical protein CDAR_565121, partial [Caerostris darwini]